MYQRIDAEAEKPEEFELPPLDIDQAVALLRSWDSDSPHEQEEQRDTWLYLKQALDEDRTSDRRLFP